MLRLFKIGIFCGGTLFSLYCDGQEAPLGIMPMQFNSSFAGEGDSPRINCNVGFSNSVKTFVSYDQFIPAIRSGIGISTAYHRRRNKNNSYISTTLALAPKFSLKGKFTISPSLDLSYGSDPYPHEPSSKGFSSRAGLLVNTNKFFVGYSVDLYRENKIFFPYSVLGHVPLVHFNSDLQMGYTFQKNPESKFSFTPQILINIKYNFVSHLNNEDLNINLSKAMFNFRYNKILWGFSDDGLMFGFQTDKLRILAHTLSPRSYYYLYSNLSFRYIFK